MPEWIDHRHAAYVLAAYALAVLALAGLGAFVWRDYRRAQKMLRQLGDDKTP